MRIAKEIIKEWNHRHFSGERDILLIQRLREVLGGCEETVADILCVLDETCHYCWDTDLRERDCYCMRED